MKLKEYWALLGLIGPKSKNGYEPKFENQTDWTEPNQSVLLIRIGSVWLCKK